MLKKNFGTLMITYNEKIIQETLHEIVTDGWKRLLTFISTPLTREGEAT
jgi:hypothetical protein